MSYDKDGRTASYVTGVSVSYSPEYRRLATDTALLEQVADAGNGRFLDPLPEPAEAGFFARDFPLTRSVQDTWRALLTAALALFYLDVFIRRVVVDYRQAARKALARAVAVLRRRPPPREAADERLATLLQRKTELREMSAARYEPAVVAEGRRAKRDVPAAAAPPAPAAAPGPAPPPGEAPGPAGPVPPAVEEGASSYTARLLEAKRRALRRGKDEKQEEP
jgi:hypothetical protein